MGRTRRLTRVAFSLTKQHILVSENCYLVVADTMVGHFSEGEMPGKRSKNWFKGNEPLKARDVFLSENINFEVAPINSKLVLSSSPGGYLRRLEETKS